MAHKQVSAYDAGYSNLLDSVRADRTDLKKMLKEIEEGKFLPRLKDDLARLCQSGIDWADRLEAKLKTAKEGGKLDEAFVSSFAADYSDFAANKYEFAVKMEGAKSYSSMVFEGNQVLSETRKGLVQGASMYKEKEVKATFAGLSGNMKLASMVSLSDLFGANLSFNQKALESLVHATQAAAMDETVAEKMLWHTQSDIYLKGHPEEFARVLREAIKGVKEERENLLNASMVVFKDGRVSLDKKGMPVEKIMLDTETGEKLSSAYSKVESLLKQASEAVRVREYSKAAKLFREASESIVDVRNAANKRVAEAMYANAGITLTEWTDVVADAGVLVLGALGSKLGPAAPLAASGYFAVKGAFYVHLGLVTKNDEMVLMGLLMMAPLLLGTASKGMLAVASRGGAGAEALTTGAYSLVLTERAIGVYFTGSMSYNAIKGIVEGQKYGFTQETVKETVQNAVFAAFGLATATGKFSPVKATLGEVLEGVGVVGRGIKKGLPLKLVPARYVETPAQAIVEPARQKARETGGDGMRQKRVSASEPVVLRSFPYVWNDQRAVSEFAGPQMQRLQTTINALRTAVTNLRDDLIAPANRPALETAEMNALNRKLTELQRERTRVTGELTTQNAAKPAVTAALGTKPSSAVDALAKIDAKIRELEQARDKLDKEIAELNDPTNGLLINPNAFDRYFTNKLKQSERQINEFLATLEAAEKALVKLAKETVPGWFFRRDLLKEQRDKVLKQLNELRDMIAQINAEIGRVGAPNTIDDFAKANASLKDAFGPLEGALGQISGTMAGFPSWPGRLWKDLKGWNKLWLAYYAALHLVAGAALAPPAIRAVKGGVGAVGGAVGKLWEESSKRFDELGVPDNVKEAIGRYGNLTVGDKKLIDLLDDLDEATNLLRGELVPDDRISIKTAAATKLKGVLDEITGRLGIIGFSTLQVDAELNKVLEKASDLVSAYNTLADFNSKLDKTQLFSDTKDYQKYRSQLTEVLKGSLPKDVVELLGLAVAMKKASAVDPQNGETVTKIAKVLWGGPKELDTFKKYLGLLGGSNKEVFGKCASALNNLNSREAITGHLDEAERNKSLTVKVQEGTFQPEYAEFKHLGKYVASFEVPEVKGLSAQELYAMLEPLAKSQIPKELLDYVKTTDIPGISKKAPPKESVVRWYFRETVRSLVGILDQSYQGEAHKTYNDSGLPGLCTFLDRFSDSAALKDKLSAGLQSYLSREYFAAWLQSKKAELFPVEPTLPTQ